MRQPTALVVGTGYAGLRHADALAELGIPFRGPVSARIAASDTAPIRDAGIDVVHVCSTNDLHAPLVRAAIDAGKHVICEKPLAPDVRAAEDLADLAERSGHLAILGYNYRFHPMVVELVARVPGLGSVHDVRGGFLQAWLLSPKSDDWRVDPARGGASRVVADIGAHWLDLAELATGRRAEAVVAHLGRLHERATADHAAMLVRFTGALVGSCVLSQASAGHRNDLELSLDGAEGSLTWRYEHPDELWVGERDAMRRVPRAEAASAEARRLGALPSGPNEARRNLLAAAYGRIGGREGPLPAPLPTFRDGVRHLRLAEAALESARRSAWIEL